jgi:hypothetical protein
MKRQLAGGRMRAVYEANLVEDTDYLELPIYDAECDARGTRSQPCLSHLSFKLLPRDRVMLTVLYRSTTTLRRRSVTCLVSPSCYIS